MIRSWWNGMRQWTAEATTWSLAIIPMNSQAGLPDAIRRLRRGLRDVRDRMARRRNRWRGGLLRWHRRRRRHGVDADHHEGIDRHEVEAVLRRRWPNAVVKELEQEAPTVAMLPGDAANLGQCRRGVEPLRIVIPAAAGSANDHLARHRADANGHLRGASAGDGARRQPRPA
jgi:hypothetical protein